MTILYKKRPYIEKPRIVLRPDFNHEQLQDCNAWWPFLTGGRDLTHDIISDIAATNTGGEYLDGSIEFRGGSDRWNVAEADNPLRSALGFSEHTLFIDFYSTETNALRRLVSNGRANDFEIGPNFSGVTVAGVPTNHLGFYAQGSFGWTDLGAIALGQRHRVLIRASSTQGVEAFIDGVRTFDSATNWTNSVDGTFELSSLYSGTTDCDCNVFDLRLWTTWLDDSRVEDIFRNQWAPFERKIWVPLPAAGAVSRTATITGAGTVAATGKREVSRSVTITGVGSVAATGTTSIEELRSATISGVGTVAATGKREVSRSATITGTGSVTAVGDTAEVRTATISGVGSVAASRTIERARSATSAGVGTVAATRTLERARAATITGVGSVAATGGIPGAAPAVDNSDPPITGGGRVMSQGSFPQWWENWEEPQPTEAAPPIPPSFAELIAEAAAELPMPSTPPPTPQPVIRRRRSRMRTTPAVRARGTIQRFTVGEATERLARRQRRQTALLLLMRLLD